MAEKVLVTGGLGFIGSHIVDALIAQKYQVIVVDNLLTGKREHVNPQANYYEMDIRDAKGMEAVFTSEQPDFIIHQAAQASVPASIKDPALDADINITGTLRLLELAVRGRAKKFVFASSAAVYGEPVSLPIQESHPIKPISFYGISKYAVEHYIRVYHDLYGLPYTIFRYANVYGPRQDPFGEGGVVSIFLDRLTREEPLVIFGDGEQTRDFVYVKDIALANVMAIQQESSDTVHLSTGLPTSVNQLVQLLDSLSDKKVVYRYENERSGDIRHSYMNNDMAAQRLNWKPQYSLQKGLHETLDYYGTSKGNE